MTNKYCPLSSLNNESDVEQFLVLPLLGELGYGPEYLETKATIPSVKVGKGKKRKSYIPDYMAYVRSWKDKPVIIVDVKHPDKAVEEGVEDAQLYASVIRRSMAKPKPDQYCIGVNGHRLVVKHYDSDTPLHELSHTDFVDGNPRFGALREMLKRESLAAQVIAQNDTQAFEFRTVKPIELPSIFETCHKKIWKAEKRSPASAFYEFAKLMFIKIDEDKRLRDKLAVRQVEDMPSGYVPRGAVRFSVHWITEMEETTDNPVNTILFAHLAQTIEEQILRGEKKRIFDEGDGVRLAPSTIKDVVKILEHLDLGIVDEDLNGRLFETFLSATMRGEALGQFFTPRAVVKFMVKLARLKASPYVMDRVLDGCCGTGGFLIEAMADMSDKLDANVSLSASERENLLHKLRTEALWGIDAGQDPPIARIARLNMLLHKDGGGRVYYADALDKQLRVEQGLPIHTKLEIDELRSFIATKTRFSLVLTNPPFAMTYEKKNPRELSILQDYELFTDDRGRPRTEVDPISWTG